MVKRSNKCLKISLSELKKDPAFKENGRGARKLLVTEILRTKEDKEIGMGSNPWKSY
jgi:hypothetical protein